MILLLLISQPTASQVELVIAQQTPPPIPSLTPTPPSASEEVWPTIGWPTATPAEMGMDETKLKQARDFAVSQGGGSGFITRAGWLYDITILHLATHTAGFDKPGGYTPLLFQPGTEWYYSDGGTNWLAEAITLKYQQDLHAVMFDRVFSPLGINSSDLRWRSNLYRPDKINDTKRREFSSGISAIVDAMARIGYLYLRKGQWEGQEIIPPL